MKWIVLLAIFVCAACSSLPVSGDQIVALQVFSPDSLFVDLDSSVVLHAVALDIHGDSIPAQVTWQTPDTAFITLDSVSGLMTGKAIGSARVQAHAGTLVSDPVVFNVRATPIDTTTTLRRRP
jgi:hypothetical protein